ncbi:MAG: hypothetical protein P1U63_03905 [Coxiellaceae bacterium]|nr:hypothetical protein [Coxiellaceae bacterium]
MPSPVDKASAEKKAIQEKILAALAQNFKTLFDKGCEITPKKDKAKDGDTPALFISGKPHDGDSFTVTLKEPKVEFDVHLDKEGNLAAVSLPKTDPSFKADSHQTWSKDTIAAHAAIMKCLPEGMRLQGLPKTTLANATGFIAAGKQAGWDGNRIKTALNCIQQITDKAGNEYSITKDGQLRDEKNDKTYDINEKGQLTDQHGTTYELSESNGLTAIAGAASGSSARVTEEADTESQERAVETAEEKDARLREPSDRGAAAAEIRSNPAEGDTQHTSTPQGSGEA